MPTVLAGGTGTPKLLWGTDPVFDPETVTVIANTGDDVELGGLLVCPDIDSVLYGRSDRLDRERWWGQANDTATTNTELAALTEALDRGDDPRYLPDTAQTAGRDLARFRRFSAAPEFLHIGDRDRAVHLLRTSLLDEGHSLTAATRQLATAFGLSVSVLPMSDDPVATIVHTPAGEMHFQEFWVARGGEPTVSDVEFRGAKAAEPTQAVLDALAEPVVIGPANPITSLGPMLALAGVPAALSETTVVAVSPFIEDQVFSGPAAKLMRAEGYEASTAGVAAALPFVDAFVLDTADGTNLDRPTIRTDTKIETKADATRVARATKAALEVV
ncbi:2-phospho-L-lactate transferase [Halodesulfurarchaeum formicicum]|uniref:2-phospho-L-lactate transferase n=1 Tax=Halodesulfurarchaeum formicicum TaxID=1873524 RepID=A0A1J1AAR4_9EURY|nr:2-phospho-L-lactate transferase [Halodesulfurarchaeum formicicum]APE94981.1 2-phospho-L-lactate transferase [Halodesulfurarchaeum formicicum]